MKWLRLGAVAAAGTLALGGGVAMHPPTMLEVAKTLERGRADLTLHEAQVDGHRVVYARGGQGPTLLLVHGFNADKDNWTRIARFFTDRFDVIAVDLPGAGESDRLLDRRYDAVTQADRLKELHDQLGLGPMHIAGNSMGGNISAVYATRHPDDVLSLSLLNPGGVTTPEPSELAEAWARGENPLVVRDAQEYDRLLEFIFVEPPWLPDAVKQHFAQIAVTNQDFSQKIWQDLTDYPARMEPIMGDIQAPTLVLWGDTDRVLHPSGAQVLHEGIPDSELVIMKDCGHAPMLERPEETASHILALIDRAGSTAPGAP